MTHRGTQVGFTEALPSVIRDGREESLRHNNDVDWDKFDPDAHWAHNYQNLSSDDRTIIQQVAGFFSQYFQQTPGTELLRGLDVGSGGNLYPALGLLPWSGRITLTDPAPASISWLRRAAAGTGMENSQGDWYWQPFWAEYAEFPGYQQLANPRQLLAARHDVRRYSVLNLARANWDIGTMFFVAESITAQPEEFADAVDSFFGALVPGAPFAVACRVPLPTVRQMDSKTIETALSRHCHTLEITRIDALAAQHQAANTQPGTIIAVGTTNPHPKSA